MTRSASTRRPGRPDRARLRARETKHTQAVRRTKDRLLAALIVTQAALFAPWTCGAPPAAPAPASLGANPTPAATLPTGRQPLLSPRDQIALARHVDALAARIVSEAKVSGLAVA